MLRPTNGLRCRNLSDCFAVGESVADDFTEDEIVVVKRIVGDWAELLGVYFSVRQDTLVCTDVDNAAMQSAGLGVVRNHLTLDGHW